MQRRSKKSKKGVDGDTFLDTSLPGANATEQNLQPCEVFEIPFIELSYTNSVKLSERPVIVNSDTAYRLLYQSWDKKKIELQEQVKVLLLNQSNNVLGVYELSTGGITSTIIDPRLVFAAAIKANATGIILAHNHPSGNLKASKTDELLTKKIQEAGRMLDINLLDHLIVTREGYFSYLDHGLI